MAASSTRTAARPAWLPPPPEESFSGQPASLTALRRSVWEQFTKTGLPTTRREAWRHTNLDPLQKIPFLAQVAEVQVSAQALDPYRLDAEIGAVCVNGAFRPDLSDIGGLPERTVLESLASAVRKGAVEQLDSFTFDPDQPAEALNMAWLRDGIYLEVPQGAVIEQPVHLYFVSTASEEPTVSFPRVHIQVGENSQLSLVEHHIGLGSQPRFTCSVTLIGAGPGAVVEYLRLLEEGRGAQHLAGISARQQAGSQLQMTSLSTGGDLVRNDVAAALEGEGANHGMAGLYLVRGREQVDNHTLIDHLAPHTSSVENYKGILDGQGRGIFTGRIVVHPDAQQTDARQTNRNLMLSDKALVHTDPQLEIFADDVKCSHGSTVGQVDDEALFYFRSRGIGLAEARRLLVHGFTAEVLQQIGHPLLREVATLQVNRWLQELPSP